MAESKQSSADTNQKVNEAEELARKAMKPQVDMWRDGIHAMGNKLPVTDPYMPNITVGRLAADIETIVPRDVQALLGDTPYMPFEATDKGNPDSVEYAAAITDVLDYYTRRGKLYTRFADMMKRVRPLGIGILEPRHKLLPVSVYEEQVVRDGMGRVVEVKEFREDTVEELVEFREIKPWAFRPHPYGDTLDEKPELCVCELVHNNEIRRLLETQGSGYKAPPGMKDEDLFSGIPENKEWHQQLRRDKGALNGDAYKDVSFVIRYYSDDRWIHTINRQHVISDTENRNENMPRYVKPFAVFRNMSHIGEDAFWPIGDYEFMMDLYWLGDMWLNLYAQAAQMYAAQWILYNPDAGIRAEDLKPIPGARIPVPGGNFDNAVQSMKVGTPPQEYLEFYRETKGISDDRLHINDWVAGRQPQRKETATAVNQLTDAGMTHMEFGITYIEQGGLTDLAYLTSKLIANNQTDGQLARIIGEERAQRVRTSDPEAIPGGYTLGFRGADRVVRQERKTQKFLQGYNLVRNQGTITAPWLLDRMLLEHMEVMDSQMLDDLGLTIEAQQQQAMMTPPPEGDVPSVGDSGAVENPSTIGLGEAQPMVA